MTNLISYVFQAFKMEERIRLLNIHFLFYKEWTFDFDLIQLFKSHCRDAYSNHIGNKHLPLSKVLSKY